MVNIKTFRPAYCGDHKSSRLVCVWCLLISSLFYLTAAINTASAATCYLDAVDGNDANPGTSDLPWRTMSKAEDSVSNGDTVYLRSGNYGGVSINNTGLSRTSWDDGVTYIAETGQAPVFNYLSIAEDEDRYLTIRDVDITAPDDSDYYAVVNIVDSSYIKIIDCNITGRWDPPNDTSNYGIKVDGKNYEVSNVLIDNCDIHHVGRGMLPYHNLGDNVIIRNSNIYKTHGTFIDIQASGMTIENNHLYGRDRAGTIYHGSGIGLSGSNDIIIRGNIIHDYGGSGGICFYAPGPPGGYKNILIENNLVYDAQGTSHMIFEYLGSNITIRNNTFIGWRNDEH